MTPSPKYAPDWQHLFRLIPLTNIAYIMMQMKRALI